MPTHKSEGGPLLHRPTGSIASIRNAWTATTGGAALLAVFEKCAADRLRHGLVTPHSSAQPTTSGRFEVQMQIPREEENIGRGERI